MKGVGRRSEQIRLFFFLILEGRRSRKDEGFDLGTICKVIGEISLQIWRECLIFYFAFVESVDVEEEVIPTGVERRFFLMKYIEIIGVFHGQSFFSTFLLKFKIL